MSSVAVEERKKPHAVCIPYPAQGHINPMLKLAKLLHHRGFYITFVNTEFNHKRLLKSRGSDSLKGLPDFQFQTIPDGLPPSDIDATQDIPALCQSTSTTCLVPFRNLLSKLNTTPHIPPVTCVVSDGAMSFTLQAAEEIGVPEVLLWTTSACGFLAYLHYPHLMDRGFTPLKDASYLSNGYLDTPLDWIPGMNGIRLKDIPTFVRTTNPDDVMLDFVKGEVGRAYKASAIILNTFEILEKDVVDALSTMLPRVYTIGPLPLMLDQIKDDRLSSIGSNLWKEESECLEWLDSKEPSSVVYVNFGSITVMTPQQLVEFAWGLANSNHTFLWIIRPDLVAGDSAVLPSEFVSQTKERGMLSSWCPQEKVLNHPAIGGFLTHSGWNSTLESICGGVPMVCWPFFADQQTNCRYSCTHWGIGTEMDNNVKRDEVEKLVRELMEGDKGKEVKTKAMVWKKKAEEATSPDGSSLLNFDNLVDEILLSNRLLP
ncbi:7-deoxyloganetin glucosyltransferase-like [Macadamia integrifolia]|uniref:7-deoxyloganetin glucosyltransferase-like n=1 Tax=Macadamia integrifolia TaxID=60698 RepID=UPI001C4FC4BC|nr:7-deoxyloganetin glucosyltransferase-like [Macadamia integrifolia]XP_042495868.1 7-deoxyloganetin glucosyltransferase-like [Macadamia integrifolia]